ncbi:MAG: 7-carboxy-7-deazaguanine synthase [Gammaproteobacteria bacterium BRH_c0]|nr:MAG: 7-carboxy-7-deazaguanine synthase [Gammaproteobacteria bacterium BRH_c0]
MKDSLRITEIFYSLQGETSTVGLPTVFVRLTGCPLRCGYCDTEYAFYGGERKSLDEVVAQVKALNAPWVTVTGGEPLAQRECWPLLSRLCDEGYRVSLETSGAISIEDVDPRVVVIMDLKTPGSGEVGRNLYDNIHRLKRGDELKFVICDRRDYDWAQMRIDEYALLDRVDNLLFSPSYGTLSATDLANWIIEDRLPVRLQLQLHKLLWNDEPGH